jgi:predicted transcriptional regulator
LGVLEGCGFVNDVMVTFHNIENMIAKAERFVWILTNQVLASTITYLMQAVERGTEFRLLMPKDYMPSKDVRELVSNPVFEKASRAKKLENRFIDKVDVFLCLSEKEVAALAFPNLNGRLDYFGFKSKSESVVDWSKALYLYHWEKASSQVPDQLTSK